MAKLMATPSSSQAAVSSALDDHVLMALPRKSLLNRTMQRKRQKLNAAANGRALLPPIPVDLTFDVRDIYKEMILFDSRPRQNRLILMGCPELLDRLARADLWLADGTF